MKKQPKPKKGQLNLRVSSVFKERLEKLGAQVGLSGNQFAIEGLDRFAETILEFLAEEKRELDKLHEGQRQRLLKIGRLARSHQAPDQEPEGHRK